MRSARNGAALFGAALVALGLIAIYKASALPLGTLSDPDAGLFPLASAIAVTLLGSISLAAKREAIESEIERAGVVRVVVLSVSVALYALLVPRAGFIICTALLLAVVLRAIGRAAWLPTGIGAIGGSIGCYALFTRLGAPLPAGWLGF